MEWSGDERRGLVAIGVMCKAPRPGYSKTRLAAAIGEEKAARLAGAFIKDAFHLIATVQRRAPVLPVAFYSPAGAEAEMAALVPPRVRMFLQEGDDLGRTMFDALQKMLEISPAGAILIGSDIPTLPADTLLQAVNALRQTGERVVFGPAVDGGYYLVGIKSLAAEPLFAPMMWGSDFVMSETRSRVRVAGLECVEVQSWYDVDTADGLAKLRGTLSLSGPDIAPATRAVLELP